VLEGETGVISLGKGRLVIPVSCHGVYEMLKVVKKGRWVELLHAPLSEGMMVAAVTALAMHSAYRFTDPFIKDFVDKLSGAVNKEELEKEVRRRYAAVGGSMRDVICSEEHFQSTVNALVSQAKNKNRTLLLKDTTLDNIPRGVRLLVYPKLLTTSSRQPVVDGEMNYKFDFRSERAALEVAKNVNMPEDVLALRNLNILDKALEHVVRHGLMLNPDVEFFDKTLPANWKKEAMHFFTDPQTEKLSASHKLMGDAIPNWPWCDAEVTYHADTLQEKIARLRDKALYRSSNQQNKFFEFLAAQQKEKIVSFWQVSQDAPSERYTRLDTVVDPVLNGLHLLERSGNIPADEWWTVRLFYFVDGTVTYVTSGWTFKESKHGKAIHIDQLNEKYAKNGIKFEGYVVIGSPFGSLKDLHINLPVNKGDDSPGTVLADCKKLIKRQLKLTHMTALKVTDVVAPGWRPPSDKIGATQNR